MTPLEQQYVKDLERRISYYEDYLFPKLEREDASKVAIPVTAVLTNLIVKSDYSNYMTAKNYETYSYYHFNNYLPHSHIKILPHRVVAIDLLVQEDDINEFSQSLKKLKRK